MPSQHKTTPLSIRLPDAERQQLKDYADRHGLPVRRVILDAIREKLGSDQGKVLPCGHAHRTQAAYEQCLRRNRR